jgi:flagellar M-ring protein FliF
MIWWTSLGRSSRTALVAGAAAILLATTAGGWWLLRTEHAVLFSELRPQDAALMTAELDKLKIPYVLGDNGAAVLVDRSQVHTVRLKLMGKELPLHGAVGFELFNHTDFGMTEFAQKINYQRALQGELTRTILSFPEIRDARVHLAMPEHGLFKQNVARPKAAITLNVRNGQVLRSEQVSGIQRLVAAAVPGLAPQEVTIVDQQGLTLSRTTDGQGEGASGSLRMELKRETENYLSRKATAVLDKAFGPGQALASVDVTLNMDQVRVTTEDVIAAPDPRGGALTGVLVRERESARDNATPDARGAEPRGVRGSSMQRDVEYQAGRRVEHLVTHPGAIRRMHVVAVVREKLEGSQRDEIVRLVGAAVGASADRGDSVVVQALQPAPSPVEPVPQRAASPADASAPKMPTVPLLLTIGIVLLGAFVLALRRRSTYSPAMHVLSQGERRATLARVQQWMLQAEPRAQDPAAAKESLQ